MPGENPQRHYPDLALQDRGLAPISMILNLRMSRLLSQRLTQNVLAMMCRRTSLGPSHLLCRGCPTTSVRGELRGGGGTAE